MIEDIEAGKINCVVTKDLSRLGRNYIMTGQYTELYFPSHNVRYIAIDDGVDSEKGESEIAPFKNIINEWVARDTSRKVKSAFKTKFAEGAHYGAYAPLGYKKHPDIKGKLLVDDETKWIIEKIFSLAYQGYGSAKITKQLRAEKVPTASWLNFTRYGTFAHIFEGKPESKRYEWTIAHVKAILKSEVYIGNSVHNMQSTVSFKSKKKVRKPESEWFRVENTHEPIIDKEVFYRVQEQIKSRRRQTKEKATPIFAGLVKCADCGWSMRFGTNKTNKTPYSYYACSYYGQFGKGNCSMHYIRYDVLYQAVLERFGYFINQVLADSIEEIFQDINKKIFETEHVDLQHLYIDGSKFEANANKYSWVWKKATKKSRYRLFGKITTLFEEINEELSCTGMKLCINSEYAPEYLKEAAGQYAEVWQINEAMFVHGRGHRKTTQQRHYEKLKEYAAKMEEYVEKIKICGEDRNSYSKTDHSATFMRIKTDYMGNDQLLPAYNVQVGVADEYIAVVDVNQYRSDMDCFIPLMNKFYTTYGFYPKYPVADLEAFLRNLLLNEKNELHNRNLHISGLLNEEKVDIGDTKVDIENGKVDIQDKKVDIDSVLSEKGSDFSVKTTIHIHRLFEKFGFDEVFGRSAVMELLELKGSGASKLLSNLVKADIIEPVSGHGNGKYKFKK